MLIKKIFIQNERACTYIKICHVVAVLSPVFVDDWAGDYTK